ncbi:MAG: hypothetical protein DRN30_00770 [Thermoplasmata archaeon]|nr:MAG: hypothetical protein DRN30_00770 [Thermoplasmata archaeon]
MENKLIESIIMATQKGFDVSFSEFNEYENIPMIRLKVSRGEDFRQGIYDNCVCLCRGDIEIVAAVYTAVDDLDKYKMLDGEK